MVRMDAAVILRAIHVALWGPRVTGRMAMVHARYAATVPQIIIVMF